jgi:hypothetical protein
LKKRKYAELIIVFAVIAIGSCSTIPKNTVELEAGDFSFLPDGGQLYLWANVNETRPLLESIEFEGLSLAHAASILDRTNTAAAVFGNRQAASTRSGAVENRDKFFISLRGRFPTFQAGLSLAFSKDWRKLKSGTGNSYWFSQGYGVGMAMDSQLALVSGGDPFSKLPSTQNGAAVRVPDGFDNFRDLYKPQGVMAGWIPDSDLVNGFLSNLGLPIAIPAEDFFFCVLKEKSGNVESWELVFSMRTASAIQARGLVSVFSLARIFISMLPTDTSAKKTDLMDFIPSLFANAPQRDEATLTLKSDSFSTADLSLLFSAISVYSNKQ